jgi:hypothetical protein
LRLRFVDLARDDGERLRRVDQGLRVLGRGRTRRKHPDHLHLLELLGRRGIGRRAGVRRRSSPMCSVDRGRGRFGKGSGGQPSARAAASGAWRRGRRSGERIRRPEAAVPES